MKKKTGPSIRGRRRHHFLWDGYCLLVAFISTIYHLTVKGEFFSCLYDVLISPIWSLIYQGCGLLGEQYKKQSLAFLFFVLEELSLYLDICGRNSLAFLLAAYLLSVFVFSITIQAGHNNGSRNSATNNRSSQQAEIQLRTVEIVFSFVQMMLTFVHFILALSSFKINLGLSIFPLLYAAIALVLAFKFGTETTDRATANGQPNQPADLENASAITTTSTNTPSTTFTSSSTDQTGDSLV